jgi:hypothetical protein
MEPAWKKAKQNNVTRQVFRTTSTELCTWEDPDKGVWGMSYKYNPVQELTQEEGVHAGSE